jgi:hypothetical protein
MREVKGVEGFCPSYEAITVYIYGEDQDYILS